MFGFSLFQVFPLYITKYSYNICGMPLRNDRDDQNIPKQSIPLCSHFLHPVLMPYSEPELACWKQLHCATTKSARKTDRRIILSSCLAWSLDVLGICLVRSCHLRSSFFRFLQHPCPAALRNGEAKCKRSWSKREISWKYIGVSTMCLDTASECRQIFCIDSASAKRLQSKLVDVSGARVSSFLALMLYMRSSEEHFWWFVHQEMEELRLCLPDACYWMQSHPGFSNPNSGQLGVAQPAVFWGRSFAKLQMW